MTTLQTLLRAWLATALVGLLLHLPAAFAQTTLPKKPADERSKDLTPFSQGLLQPTQPELLRKLEAAQDYIKTRGWEKAAQLLQGLLDAPEDVFIPFKRRSDDGREQIVWSSQRAEADRLLNALPAEGLVFYQFLYGNTARDLLAEARQHKDPERLAAVVQRFLHTTAGAAAAAQLAAYHLDRGRPLMASLCYQRLLDRAEADKLPPVVLFQAALALERCGETLASDRAWKRLAESAPNGLELNGKRIALDDLNREMTRSVKVGLSGGAMGDWVVYRGHPHRQGQGPDCVPTLDARWKQGIDADALTRCWLDAIVRQHDVRAQAVLPNWFPIVTRERVFARTLKGIAAFDLNSGKLLWESASSLALDNLALDSGKAPHVDRWIDAYRTYSPSVLLENSVVGTLSSDGQRVYAIEDLALPPYPQNYSGFLGKAGMGLDLSFTKELSDAVYHSRLIAIDARSGKVIWEHGGRTERPEPAPKDPKVEDTSPPLHDSFLMGPPMPLGGKLYLLSEKDQSLRLTCLDPIKGEVSWTQKLALNKSRMVLDGGRRLHAAHLAYGEGILVCPTNSGGLIAIDLLSHSLLWAHAYREEEPPPLIDMGFGGMRRRPVPITAPPNLTAEWKTTAPIIVDGRVIFAAPDDPNIHCVHLRDGRPAWKVSKAPGELFLAGVGTGKVLMVGNTECRALSLETGAFLWGLTVGVPAGQGVMAGDNYLLPIKAAVKDRQAGLAIIDLDKGELREFLTTPPNEVVGNLLIHEGTLISQGLDGVKAYPLTLSKPGDKR